MKLENPDVRYLKDIENVVFDKEWLKEAPNIELYYMYRNLERRGSLRYDITVIPAQMLGSEFVKTKGHYHPKQYGELYIVLEGEAIYLMQKVNEENEVVDIYAVEAKKGNYVVIPKDYGHITINPGPESLKMANWVYDGFQSNYSLIEEKGGAAYFYTINGWIKNDKYSNVPDLRFEVPEVEEPKDLSFLN
ncbi:MAG: glucose-6-phosphate isomerase family protein [Candidatus Pacebacteria bacterium]|nr:glucose-6-phosphate isomerase family protein [Candidatus Paceibacterota bacterium]